MSKYLNDHRCKELIRNTSTTFPIDLRAADDLMKCKEAIQKNKEGNEFASKLALIRSISKVYVSLGALCEKYGINDDTLMDQMVEDAFHSMND